MSIQALSKNVKISPLKVRLLARLLVGMLANDALQCLRTMPQKSAKLISKTLKSAISNAENNMNLSGDNLIISSAVVDEGIAMKRYQPVSRGSAHPIRKRSSHLKIILSACKEQDKSTNK